jgi:hypothetical protein
VRAPAEGRPVFDLLAEVARDEGADVCVAPLGDANTGWATRLMQRGARLIAVRHEHCAVAAAAAWARKIGRPGLATVTCGPGLTQILTALPAAVRARIPLVVFAGEAPIGAARHNQEIDRAPFVTATGARYMPLPHVGRDGRGSAQRLPGVAGGARPGRRRRSLRPPEPSHALLVRAAPIPPNPEDLARAAALVAGKRRVVVMAGLGAVEAGAAPPARRWRRGWARCSRPRFPPAARSRASLSASASRADFRPPPRAPGSPWPTS